MTPTGVELLDVRPAYVNSRGMRVGARLPLHPLIATMLFDAGRDMSPVEIARQLGATPTAIYRARREGLTVWKADEWALTAERHPVEVWGDDWWRVDVPDVEDELDVPEVQPLKPWWESIAEANRLRASKRRHPSNGRPGPRPRGGTRLAA